MSVDEETMALGAGLDAMVTARMLKSWTVEDVPGRGGHITRKFWLTFLDGNRWGIERSTLLFTIGLYHSLRERLSG